MIYVIYLFFSNIGIANSCSHDSINIPTFILFHTIVTKLKEVSHRKSDAPPNSISRNISHVLYAEQSKTCIIRFWCKKYWQIKFCYYLHPCLSCVIHYIANKFHLRIDTSNRFDLPFVDHMHYFKASNCAFC